MTRPCNLKTLVPVTEDELKPGKVKTDIKPTGVTLCTRQCDKPGQ